MTHGIHKNVILKYLKFFVDFVVAIPIGLFIVSLTLFFLTIPSIAFSIPAILLTFLIFRFFQVPDPYYGYAAIGWVIFHGILISIKCHLDDKEPRERAGEDYGPPKI